MGRFDLAGGFGVKTVEEYGTDAASGKFIGTFPASSYSRHTAAWPGGLAPLEARR